MYSVGIFVKGIGRAGNRTAALLITKRRTRCVTTTPNARVTRRWKYFNTPPYLSHYCPQWTNNPFYRRCHSLALASRLVRSGHGPIPDSPCSVGITASLKWWRANSGARPPCWNFCKRNRTRWESNRSSPHYKAPNSVCYHYTKHPCDQEVEIFQQTAPDTKTVSSLSPPPTLTTIGKREMLSFPTISDDRPNLAPILLVPQTPTLNIHLSTTLLESLLSLPFPPLTRRSMFAT